MFVVMMVVMSMFVVVGLCQFRRLLGNIVGLCHFSRGQIHAFRWSRVYAAPVALIAGRAARASLLLYEASLWRVKPSGGSIVGYPDIKNVISTKAARPYRAAQWRASCISSLHLPLSADSLHPSTSELDRSYNVPDAFPVRENISSLTLHCTV